jgi:hypothetical protein
MAASTLSSAWTNASGEANFVYITNLAPLSLPSTRITVAWHHRFHVLRDQLRNLGDAYVLFEYELPRERRRRPDVVSLTGGTVLILKFKDYGVADRAYIDQVAAFAQDLRHYHARSHSATVVPVLVLTASIHSPTTLDDVSILASKDLARAIAKFVSRDCGAAIDPEAWMASPLPTLVAATKTIFQHEPLPQIRRAHSAGTLLVLRIRG